MRIAIASGKGGTGKTTMAVGLALSIEGAQYLDCDVEEPNGHLFLHPERTWSRTVGIAIPRIAGDRCDGCGLCARNCAFNALAMIKQKPLLFPALCHGCGACVTLCPTKAMSESSHRIGIIEGGWSGKLSFAQGLLDIGQPMPTPIIRELKKLIDPARTALLDAPPGTGCPVVETVRGCDACLLVTEPTPFGLHDLELAVEMCRVMGVPRAVVLNRCNLGDGSVERYCQGEGIPILLSLPFSRRLAEGYARGLPITRVLPEYSGALRGLPGMLRRLTGTAGGQEEAMEVSK